ncbi:uncharacterized protein BT62DRAFT_937813 [Guyanagaster necrorhizus]|uniref:Uncharacterized protein n=1 Tax=Guyanagaster necrorhizus TaxID=856835 RepID=A0A9P7VGP0_9AGAR|nr:uncharacterized protein BT62DRAFT_937807 [Guyanagaster necrorhizus MCA 3950]XP_043034182.1 uncharacterized protein BT62DRAFT_937813 [Guyanagaster necrorhizus MCA 3950]KAG7440671.1 hypothetical protein BT62DRAFT_937807 [Guyanagaster necrorhizus MCA 3950]KAG7440682.1 hypothetical protein BT62DRAFT_937813 [Guyanagaster necrorhizus MCA 3950]
MPAEKKVINVVSSVKHSSDAFQDLRACEVCGKKTKNLNRHLLIHVDYDDRP